MEGINLFKKNLALLLVLVMVVASFAGCAAKPAEPVTEGTPETPVVEEPVVKNLTWNLGSEPLTIDPGLNAASDGGDMINNMFEGLMREVNGELQPAMAESYTVSDDQIVYTFTLRDALWSDGQPVTANDFEYAWTRVLDPATASEYSWIFGEANVDTFRAIDEKTFEVTLAAPTPYFLGLTGFYTFFPVREDSVVQGPDGSWAINPEASIVNGPFYLSEYKTGDKIVLAKNENYWQADKVMLDTIEAFMIVDATTALTAYETGELDVIDNMPAEDMPRLMAEDDTFYILPMDGVYYYSFNTTVEPLDNELVRKAMSYAIDRTAIVDAMNGGQLPAVNMVSPASRDADGNVFSEKAGAYVPADGSGVAEAQALLAEAGYPNGEGFPVLEILYNTSEGHKMVAEIIQEMWKTNLGIDITLTNQEWAVFQTTRTNGEFQIAREGWIGDYSDPMTYLGMFVTDGAMNHTAWSSPDYDALLDASKTAAPADRFNMLYEALDILMASNALMPIYVYTDSLMVANNVIGWEKTSRNVFWFGFADLQ
ncbi:MAG: peptide ABC transporter substrate-binding protein [Clostridiales bacterium]|nr:peptide ABC transporter substrate-binding protein [Clostridiales bacterium]